MSKNLFSVLPMSKRISLSAGETYEGSITIVNPANASEDFSYLVEITPYNVIDSDYKADLSTMNIYTQIADWATVLNPRGTISPNESATINYTITVPEDAPAGGQYATLLVSSDPEAKVISDNVSINNTYQLASVIYADVSGETHKDCIILENNIPNFSFNPTITLESLIQNSGNVHEDAIFTINATNAFTGETIYPAVQSEDDYNRVDLSEIIMPETTRYIAHEINNLPLLGLVKVNQTIYIDDVPTTTEKEIFICPLWFIVLVILTITSLIALIIHRIIKHRRQRKANI